MSSLSLTIARTLCLLLPVVGSAAAAPYTFESAPGRLPKDVVPVDYTIAVTPHLKTLTIEGSESVLLDVRKPVSSITLNSLNERLSHVTVDGRPVKEVHSDDQAQLTTITLKDSLRAGSHTLRFTYTGKIEKAPQGLFAQDYHDAKGKPAVLLSTQMEATDARRLFPCWDEPAFRATFTLTATVPAAWMAVSNMPMAERVVRGKLATVRFDRSPKMPSYLVVLTAGDLNAIEGSGDGTALRVIAPAGREVDGKAALANAADILADYNNYFGYRFPLPKLDSIAVPGGFQGAMENWGAITYNDQTLLVNADSTTADRQEVFDIQAHEMAHQWFGDLVTMGWWDEIWLNESFASWMAAKETADRHPNWNWWEGEDASKETAMRADAIATSHPIEQHVVNELDASNAFDSSITYNKGQAVLRMLESYVGPDVFRSALRQYMQDHAFSNTTGTDLWNALSNASHQDVTRVAKNWTTQPGFPLISVSTQCAADGARTLVLSQQRFFDDGSTPTDAAWSVPMQIRASLDGELSPFLLTAEQNRVEAGRCDSPLSLNANSIGYYRVSYDAASLALNTQHFASLRRADRIAMLDDQWALTQAGRAPLAQYLKLASGMGTNLDARSWTQISNSLSSIERALRTTPQHDAFASYARGILNVPFSRLGWESPANETADLQRLRVRLIGYLGAWGDPAVLAESKVRYARFLNDRASVAPDLQEAILANVASSADAATFESLHQLARSVHDQAQLMRYYGVLMQVRDPALASRAATIAMSDEIPAEAQAGRLGLISAIAGENPAISWAVLNKDYDKLFALQAMFSSLTTAQAIPRIYSTSVPLDQIETFVRSKVPAQMNTEIERGLTSARLAIKHQDLLRAQTAEIFH